ncbi:IQ calmodulin-binding motif family protein [Rhynchospora pubera]|uniref:IQ calmodulin-binding motif family protein n=1 Tax=Rhynchospora pubera TaxID=906938 RepID=A0AAV8GGJ0_9POAL|nr:IQ calmodulin-binding motif family protein [Rhynchospora pubera]
MSNFHHHRFDPFDPFFSFPSASAPSCPVTSSSLYYHRESALYAPPFPFPPLPSSHAFDQFSSDLDLFAPPPTFDRLPISSCPYFNSSSSLDLLDLSDRVTSLELGAYRHCPAFNREVKHTWTTEIKGDRKYKWVAESKSNGEKSYEYEAEVECPCEDGFDRKYKWKAESDGKVKWTKEIKGKGCHEPWAHKYTCEESLYGEGWKKCHEKKKIKDEKKKDEKKEEKKCHEKKEKHSSARVVEIEDSTHACAAIRKAFHKHCVKGKKKELSPQDAAMMIQMNYRAHLAKRSQVLRCLRQMAVAKARLKEIRDLFYNFAYRRRVACDAAERQSFSQKIKVLLLTVQDLEGPDYMVRVAKKSMLEELEAMLEVIDPQPPGSKYNLLRRCRFDLPEGPISEELHSGISDVVRIIEKEE